MLRCHGPSFILFKSFLFHSKGHKRTSIENIVHSKQAYICFIFQWFLRVDGAVLLHQKKFSFQYPKVISSLKPNKISGNEILNPLVDFTRLTKNQSAIDFGTYYYSGFLSAAQHSYGRFWGLWKKQHQNGTINAKWPRASSVRSGTERALEFESERRTCHFLLEPRQLALDLGPIPFGWIVWINKQSKFHMCLALWQCSAIPFCSFRHWLFAIFEVQCPNCN